MGAFHAGSTANAIPISLVSESGLGAWLNAQTASTRTWAAASGFRGERQKVLVVPGSQGDVACVALGVGNLASLATLSLWHTALLPDRLPSGVYAFAEPLEERPAGQAALGWAVGAYRFERYRKAAPRTETALVWPDRCDRGQVESAARAIAWARDLINTPTNDMSPAHLAAEAVHMAERFGATHELLVGEELLKRNYPAVHATAQMIMESALPIRLRVLVPAVENSISGDAYRPGDILRTRKGLSVEVGNTDAEGRLILGDCLAEADASGSDLIIDLATLTGAARIALGPELPAAYSNDAALLDDFVKIAEAEHDPVWPMPLWPGYEDEFASKVADLNNVSSTSYAGSVIAALFLGRFVTACPRWLHVDLFAWNAKERPGRPVGAEAQCVRAVHALLTQRYGR